VIDASHTLFAVEEVASSDELLRLVSSGTDPGLIGLWSRDGGAVLCVDRDRVGSWLGAGSEELRWLDVSVLSATLSQMIGSTTETLVAESRLAYVSDARQAIDSVVSSIADVCFLLRPTPIDSVVAVAAHGEHMPAKSTYFHPKAATGLVFNPLD
jgi:hypothetical protein